MRYLFYVALLLSLYTSTFAVTPPADKSTSISGFVLDSATKEPIVAATITIKGTKLGALSNKSGFFSVKNIPTGKVTVRASMVGYTRFEQTIDVKENEARKITIHLASSSITSESVVVTAEREEDKREIAVSAVNIPVEQMKTIRIGGESDVFRAIQFLPGVLSSSQISSGLYIRGGSPDQNLVLVDGSNVYNPSHLFGFISTFNPEAIKDVELIKGGFPAQYGGRMSAVLDLTQKEGNKDNFEGLVSLGLISSRASLQGPIGNGSWFLGGRRTYLDLLLSAVPQDPENPLPNFNFYDVNFKVTQALGPDDKIYFSGFLTKDNLLYDAPGVTFTIGLGNKVGSVRWTHVYDESVFSTVNFSASNYSNGFKVNQSDFESEVSNSITDYSLKADVEWFATNELTIKTGYEGTMYHFKFLQDFSGQQGQAAEQDTIQPGNTNFSATDFTHALYVQGNYQFTDDFSSQVGIRASYWDTSKVFMLDPRFALRYQLAEGIAIKGAFGVFHQYFRLASLQDFSFFDTWLPNDGTVPASYARHYILSLETKPYKGYEINFDAYYKELYNLSELKQFQTAGKSVADVFYNGNGTAYGIELFAQKRIGDFTGWAGYAYGWVWGEFPDINNGAKFHPKYDRRHDFKLVGNYHMNDTWEFGGSFTFQSGQPYTLVTSRFKTTLPDENVNKSVNFEANRYALRLPASHQLNLNAVYNTTIFGLKSKVILDVYNVYSRRDIWFRVFDTQNDVTEVKDIRLLPIIPTLSLEMKF